MLSNDLEIDNKISHKAIDFQIFRYTKFYSLISYILLSYRSIGYRIEAIEIY